MKIELPSIAAQQGFIASESTKEAIAQLKANLDALRTLKELQREDRLATAGEQAILAQRVVEKLWREAMSE